MTKPTLKFRKEVVITVDSFELDSFVEQVLGQPLEFIASEECSNNSQHRYVIDGKLDKWSAKCYLDFKKGENTLYPARAVLNGLCSEGYIEPGTYLIVVCWWRLPSIALVVP